MEVEEVEMVKKLHVPAPGESPQDPYGIDEVLFYPFLLCLVLAGLGALYWPGKKNYEAMQAELEALAASEAESILPAKAVKFFAMSEQALGSYDWDDEARAVVLEHGPRRAGELVCEHLRDELITGEVLAELRQALAASVKAGSPQAPWSCLSLLYWDDQLKQVPELEEVLEQVWSSAGRFEADSALIEGIVADFRAQRRRPRSEEFFGWLRHCGMRLDWGSEGECLRLLRQIAPAQGEDFLLMVDRHLSHGELAEETVIDAVTALGHVAIHGQPSRWRIEETRALPAYDFDARVGAIFLLCRLVNSPSQEVSRAAARRLSQTGAVSVRATDPHLVFRWRAGCRIAFGPSEADPYTSVPVLGVWTGEADADPIYGLEDAVERGDCEVREGLPMWSCGVRSYNGKGRTLQQFMSEVFTETRYVEWADW
jgi:hypothetical protein